MKLKMNKINVLFFLIAALFTLIPMKQAYAIDNGAQVVIHKKKMLDFPAQNIQNTGQEMSEFDSYQGLADVSFAVYDVTNAFYEARANGSTVDEAKSAVQNMTTGTPVSTGETNSDGELTMSLPKKQSGKDAVYVIKENEKTGVTPSANMVIAFPVYELIKQADGSYKYGTEELNTVHLYPKNVVENSGILQVKKIGSAEEEALNGAEFVIRKEDSEVTKYIQGVAQGIYTWTTDKEQAKHFISGNSYAVGDGEFVESAIEKGQLHVHHLEVGEYVLEEVKAPEQAELVTSQTNTTFTIVSNSQTPVEKTVKNDTSKVEKTTSELNGQDVAIGEIIRYEITTNIPLGIADKEGEENKYTKFNLVDTHDQALTFINQAEGTTGYVLYDGNQVIDTTKYQVIEETNGFTVAINPAAIPSLTPGGTLRFVYSMYLNHLADPTKGYKNEANVDNGHTTDQTPPTVEVVTGGKRFIKVDGSVDQTQPLADATFVVRDQDSETAKYAKIDAATKAVSWTTSKEEATTFTTVSDGLIDITGLKYGTYYLEEVEAPNNYVRLNERIAFEVDSNSYFVSDALVAPDKVPNKHKGTLPATGGQGILLYLGIGIILLTIAGMYWVRKQKAK